MTQLDKDALPRSAVELLTYFAVPLVIGAVVGLHRESSVNNGLNAWMNVVAFSTHYLILWAACFAALSVQVRWAPSALRHIVIALPVSAIIGIFFARPLFWARYRLQAEYLAQLGAPPSQIQRPFIWIDASQDFLLLMAQLYAPGILAWCFFSILTVNSLRRRRDTTTTDLPLVDKTAPDTVKGEGRFAPEIVLIRKLKGSLGTEIRWMKAEGHYLRVRTRLGEDLILHKFGDATEQMRGLGTQIHRSSWVAHSAFEGSRIEDMQLILDDGDALQIGPSFLGQAREAVKSQSRAMAD